MYVIQSRMKDSQSAWRDTGEVFESETDALRSLLYNREFAFRMEYQMVLRTDEVMDA